MIPQAALPTQAHRPIMKHPPEMTFCPLCDEQLGGRRPRRRPHRRQIGGCLEMLTCCTCGHVQYYHYQPASED